jgi:hypothetical protein
MSHEKSTFDATLPAGVARGRSCSELKRGVLGDVKVA